VIHNELKEKPELQRALAIIAGAHPEASGVERLGETLTPILDLFARPEHNFVLDEELTVFANSAVIAAGAGRSFYEIVPQPGFQFIIEGIYNHTGATLTVRIGDASTIVGSGVGSVTLRDTRWGRAPQVSTKLLAFSNNAAGSIATFAAQLKDGQDLREPWIIDGGTKLGSTDQGKLVIEAIADATALNTGLSVYGRVRSRKKAEQLG